MRNPRSDLIRRLMLATLLCAAFSGGLSGCAVLGRLFHRPAPCALQPGASYSQIVAKVNQNFAPPAGPPLEAWECVDAKLTMNGMPFDTTISVQAPHQLRIRVSTLISGSQVVDFGSNPEEVWFWGQGGPGVVTASHQELPLLLNQMQIPLDPEWLMEVLGVVPIDPEQYELKRSTPDSRYLDLVADRSAPSGEPVRRVIRVDACYGRVVEHRIESIDGATIAVARLENYEPDATGRYMLPRLIQVEWPRQDSQLTFRMRQIQTEAQRLTADWSVPRIPGYAQLRVGQPAAMGPGQPAETDVLPVGDHGGPGAAVRLTLPVLSEGAPPEGYFEAASQSSSDRPLRVRESAPRPFP